MRVTLALMTYNQAPYLAEAIDSALAQDYRDLRLLISDNGSSDETPEIIQRAKQNYHGPHEIEAFRFAQNTGSPSSHLNALAQRLRDEIAVLQAGDDRSHPGRVTFVVKAFADNPKTQMVFHAWRTINAAGRVVSPKDGAPPPDGGDHRDYFASVTRYALGATLAIRTGLLLDWPPLPHDIFEDMVLPFRAALMGPVIFLPEPLLDYRRHPSHTGASDHNPKNLAQAREVQRGALRRATQLRLVRLADLRLALERGLIDKTAAQRLEQTIDSSLKHFATQVDSLEEGRRRRWAAVRKLWRKAPSLQARANLLVMALWPAAWTSYRRWRQKR